MLATLTSTIGLALVLIAMLAPASARAAFGGSPGRIALANTLDGTIGTWDPGTRETTALPTGDLRCPAASTGVGSCVGIEGTSAPEVAWSPDGTQIAYSRWMLDGSDLNGEPRYHSAIFVMNADGGGQHQVTHPPATVASRQHQDGDLPADGAGFSDFSPSWSPDGTRLAFIRAGNVARDNTADRANAGSQIWLVDAVGGGASRLTHVPLSEDVTGNMWEDDPRPPGYQSVAWSPAGDTLAAFKWADFGGPFELDQVSLSGGATKLVDGLVSDYDWSPDGERLAYVVTDSETVTVRDADGVRVDGGPAQTGTVRYSPDDNGPLAFRCTGPADCGLHEHLLPDPGSNLRIDDPDPNLGIVAPTPDGETGRSPWDVQAQDLPIVFLPGFLGSEIACGDELLWPPGAFPPTNGSHLQQMRLDGAGCAGAHPTGEALGRVLFKDIYAGVQSWLDDHAPGGDEPANAVYGWDWRKSPDASILGLDAAIDQALAEDLPQRQGADRVVLLAHSYGGLLARWYMDDPGHADRVARVLTAGTPWWGSPKVALPLAFGIESPLSELGMDFVLPNDDLQALARTIPGLYELFPSDHFGPWLSIGGRFQDQDGVAATVAALGANPALFPAARSHHQEVYDGFFSNGGRTDVQAVVGSGLPTFGAVDLGTTATSISWTNGDGTVPLRSAMQGTDPDHPLGDRVHVQEVCGIGHVGLPNADRVLEPYREFLLSGRTPRRTEGHCSDQGAEIDVFDLHVDLPAAAGVRAASDGPLTLADAFQAGDIDLLDLPDRTVVVSSARDPVALTFSGQGLVFEYVPISGDRKGTALRYGPVSGTIVIAPGAAAPVVTADGQVVSPEQSGEPPGGGPPPGTPSTPPGTPPPGTGTGVHHRASARLEVTRSAVRRHRLQLVARLTRLADGDRVKVDVAVGKRHVHLARTVRKGSVRIARRLRRARTGKVTLSYAGSAAVRRARTQLLAARRAPHLKVGRLRLHAGRLRATGTIARKARGTVRLVLEWEDAAGSVHTWNGRARVKRGHWSASAKLPAAARGGGDLTLRYAGDRRAAIGGAQAARRLVAH